MRPNLHPHIVNGRSGDPALYVEMLHRKGALLFDIGDLSTLSARDLLRVSHVFVTHTHIDHFIGFDALLRVSVGRERSVEMVGPAGFLDRLQHKLLGYEWDLVDRYDADLIFDAKEVHRGGHCRSARFRFKNAFQREALADCSVADGVVATGPGFDVRAQVLDHHGPCLGFAVAERAHVNVWKNRLEERGLATGQWLQALKQAVIEGAGDDLPIALPSGETATLGSLRDLVSVTRGQKIAYVSDVADTPSNREAIAALAGEADTFFLEARFAADDKEQARERAHLTTTACGEIARVAGVRRLEPFHFSPRYEGEEARMLGEVEAAFGRALAP
jgi:ribonuclease Z